MKRLQIALALLLAALLLMPTAAFALDNGDEIEWFFGDDTLDTYTYLGTAARGASAFTAAFSAFSFTAEESGLYRIEVTMPEEPDAPIGWSGVSETFADGAANGVKPTLRLMTELPAEPEEHEVEIPAADDPATEPETPEESAAETVFSAYYFTAGETQLIGLDNLDVHFDNPVLQISYLGEPAALALQDPDKTYLIGGSILGEAPYIQLQDYCVLTMADDTVYYADLFFDGTVQRGPCTLTPAVLPQLGSITVNCVAFEELVREIRFPAGYQPVGSIYYNSDIDLDSGYPETLDFVLTDGTVITSVPEDGMWSVFAPIELCDATVWCEVALQQEADGTPFLAVYACDELRTTLTCEITPVSRTKNLSYFAQMILADLNFGLTEARSSLTAEDGGLRAALYALHDMVQTLRSEFAMLRAAL